MKIVLKKSLTLGGKSLNEINLDLDVLTSNDVIEAEKEVMARDNMPVVTVFNRSFLVSLAAKALKIPTEALMNLHIKDFIKITDEVQRFLTVSDSVETNTAKIPEKVSETH